MHENSHLKFFLQILKNIGLLTCLENFHKKQFFALKQAKLIHFVCRGGKLRREIFSIEFYEQLTSKRSRNDFVKPFSNIIFKQPEPENKESTRKDNFQRSTKLNSLAKSKRQFDYEFCAFPQLAFKSDCPAHCFCESFNH
jgi:hypothetical protein